MPALPLLNSLITGLSWLHPKSIPTTCSLVGPVPWQTRFGESIGLVSSASGWDTKQPLRLEWSEGSIWCGEAELPAG